MAAISQVARAWCSTSSGAAMLPMAALSPLAMSLLPATTPAVHAMSDSSWSEGDAGGEYGDDDDGRALTTSALACTVSGLTRLGDAGVLERCANDFVDAAEAGDASVAILHSDVNVGCRVPILTALCKLAGILAWPHAVQTAIADSTNATLTRAFELPFVRLLTLAPSTSSAAGSPLPFPRNFEESHASGLLLCSLLCADLHVAMRLRSHFGLFSTRLLELCSSSDQVPIIDLNAVCRARLLVALEHWGVPSEWPQNAALRALATRAEHPYERLCAATPAAATPSSTTGAEGDAAIEAIKSSKSSRVQLAAPLLCSPAVKQLVGMIWAHCQGRVADPLNADDLDNAKPPDTTTSPPPSAAAVSDEVASSISLLVDYHARTQEPPATAEQRAAKRDALSSLLLSECGGKFDPFASIAYLLLGDADVARALLAALRDKHAAGPYLRLEPSAFEAWVPLPPTAAADGSGHAPSARGTLLALVEEIVAVELPEMHAAMQACGLPTALPAARWLSTSWLNFLEWRSLTCANLLPLLLGADCHVYLCVAAMRHVGKSQRAGAPSAALHLSMLLPLEGFDALAEMPYILDLRQRHGARCRAALLRSTE